MACGIAHRPRLIFLDEPTVAVDPQSRNQILEGICELNRPGLHDYIYFSLYGRSGTDLYPDRDHGSREIIASGTKEELKKMDPDRRDRCY